MAFEHKIITGIFYLVLVVTTDIAYTRQLNAKTNGIWPKPSYH